MVIFDAASLLTSMNIKNVLKFLIDKIYDDKETFFPPENKSIKINGEVINIILEPPPKNVFSKFFSSIISEFNSFEALNGFLRQRKGCKFMYKTSNKR